MNAHSGSFGLKGLALIAVLAGLVFGSMGITGAAAQSAIPGDTLYSVKSTIEQARLSLARDAGERAELKLSFAEQRLREIQTLIREGRYHEVAAAVLAFEADLHGAILEMQTMSAIDPQRSRQIASAITAALTRFEQSLSSLPAGVPESVSMDVTRALDTTQIAKGLGLTPTDSLSDDNSNANFNGDDNSNVNGDDNSNLNGDDNSNINGDDNSNINGDDNSNFNGDDNSNLNGDDSNTNGDDHGGSGGGGGNGGGDGGGGNGGGDGGGDGGGGSGGGG